MATRVNQIERWKRLNAEMAFELTKYIRDNDDFARQIAKIFSRMRDGEPPGIATHGDVDAVGRFIIDRASRSDRELNRGVPSPTALAFAKHAVVPRLIEALESKDDPSALCDSAVADSEARG